MKKGIILSLILCVTMAASAAASMPMMLSKGHKSLGFESDTNNPTINFGWNITDMTKVQFGGGWTNSEQAVPSGTESDSITQWNFNVGVARYMTGFSEVFAPFFGASVFMVDSGIDGADSDFGFRGYFGVEAFVVDALSIGGNVGISYTQQGDYTQGGETFSGGKSVTTSSSAITANLYW